MHKRFVRLLLGARLTAAVAYELVAHMDKVRANVSQRDFIQYWAAGKLLIHRDNPYDVKARSNWNGNTGMRKIVRSYSGLPSWSLFLFLPWGLANAFGVGSYGWRYQWHH